VRDGVELARGNIYVAPPDCHLHVEDGRAIAITGPRENGHRPAIDPLFRSAAHAVGPRAVGVVLSGTLNDGTLGLRAIKAHGGVALVQDPESAQHSGMPTSAIASAQPDTIGSPAELARAIVELANDPVESDERKEGATEMNEYADDVADQTSEDPQPGNTTGLTCPECGGAIWQENNGNVVALRCRVGHQYTAETFAAEQGETVEAAVWAALRLIEERVVLVRGLAARFKDQPRTAASFNAQVVELERHAVALRGIVDGVTRSVAVSADG
jgi:two-component system chemotaxis response regulator CheB